MPGHDTADVAQRLYEQERAKKQKPTLCLDFDGVIHSYTSGWKGIDVIPDPPVDGAIEFLYEAICHFDVCIYSTRSETDAGIKAMQEWLAKWEQVDRNEREKWGMAVERTSLLLNIRFPKTKPLAFVGIDDRVITFTGHWPDMDTLKNFKPWNKK
jgi:hypothetical protein